ncbi:MAG: hypothetical protein Q8K59_09530 [Nitrosomonas sp.]|nr:hypothetical protein [Nitrosomonas sp.]MDP1951315.1 hypothetical protein [Nitrosomonas sp.]
MRKLLLTISLLVVVTPTQAEWVRTGADTAQGVIHYFDSETMQKEDHFRKVWALSSHDEMQIGGYHSVKTLFEFDCAEERVRSQTMLLYSGVKASGDVVGAHHKEEPEDWFDFPPDSIFNVISTIVCTK